MQCIEQQMEQQSLVSGQLASGHQMPTPVQVLAYHHGKKAIKNYHLDPSTKLFQ